MTTEHATHTPGPWEAYNGHDRKLGSWAILGPQPVGNRASQVICRTSDDGPTDAANARLIAAAPALEEALEGLLHELDPRAEKRAWDTHRAALAQARGA